MAQVYFSCFSLARQSLYHYRQSIGACVCACFPLPEEHTQPCMDELDGLCWMHISTVYVCRHVSRSPVPLPPCQLIREGYIYCSTTQLQNTHTVMVGLDMLLSAQRTLTMSSRMVSPRSLCDAPAYEAKHLLEGTCNRVEWKVETELSHTLLFLPICRHSNALHNSLPLCDCNPPHAQLRASTAAWPHTLSPASTNLLSTCLCVAAQHVAFESQGLISLRPSYSRRNG